MFIKFISRLLVCFIGVLMAQCKIDKELHCRKGTLYGLNLCLVSLRNLSVKVLLGKLSFSLGSFVSSCIVYSVRVVLVSGLVRLYGSFGYGKPN